MPSYRVSLAVGLLEPGVNPVDVLPAAAAAARELTTVEANDVDVVAGQARITVRYQGSDDDAAIVVARAVIEQVTSMAATSRIVITRRYGSRWHPVR